MKKTKVKVDRRKHKRFRAQDGVFVIPRPSDTVKPRQSKQLNWRYS
jgi:hypothetical protein